MNKTKLISIVLVLLIGLLGLTAIVSATSDLYDITDVEVDDVLVDEDTVSGVELDDSIEVKVYIEGTGTDETCDDVDDCAVEVKVKAWIGGYEYDDIEATSSSFDIEPGVSYTKTLTLDLPSDLDVEDEEYTLYVEVYDSEDSEKESYSLYAERPEHSLEIIDAIYDSNIDAGKSTTVEVRVENLGDEKEEDIKVEATLGEVSASDYIEELAAYEIDNEDEESSDSTTLKLNIPSDVTTGSYDLTITVTYNRGHDVLEETYTVNVNGNEETTSNAETTVSLDSTNLKFENGEANTLALSFTNSGSSSETYTISANGISQWATSSVKPSTITVAPDSTETVSLELTPDDDASGNYDWSIQILDNEGNLVEDIAMSASVEENPNLETSSWLKIGFVILIVLIVLIAIIVAVRKIKDDEDDDDEELEPKEGKTYY